MEKQYVLGRLSFFVVLVVLDRTSGDLVGPINETKYTDNPVSVE